MTADRPANTGDSARRNRPSPIHSHTGAARRLLVSDSGSVDVLEHADRGFRFFVKPEAVRGYRDMLRPFVSRVTGGGRSGLREEEPARGQGFGAGSRSL